MAALTTRFSILALSMTLLCTAAVADHHSPLLDSTVCAPDGIALGGYDVVSYFSEPDTSPRPVLGVASFTHQIGKLSYRFASKENLEAFKLSPTAYLPTYRGWCSATLAMGRLVCPNYTNFKIEDGELLLFEVIGFTNGLDAWNSDPKTNRANADGHYERLLND